MLSLGGEEEELGAAEEGGTWAEPLDTQQGGCEADGAQREVSYPNKPGWCPLVMCHSSGQRHAVQLSLLSHCTCCRYAPALS